MAVAKKSTQAKSKSKKSIPHLIIGDPLPETPLFNDAGEFQLNEFPSDRDAHLINYPVGTFIGMCLYSIIELESVYNAMNVSSHYGSFHDAMRHFYNSRKDQSCYENMNRIPS